MISYRWRCEVDVEEHELLESSGLLRGPGVRRVGVPL